jgi:hypothetical protein
MVAFAVNSGNSGCQLGFKHRHSGSCRLYAVIKEKEVVNKTSFLTFREYENIEAGRNISSSLCI